MERLAESLRWNFGVYSIIVEAHHAKGRVHIQQKGEKKDAH